MSRNYISFGGGGNSGGGGGGDLSSWGWLPGWVGTIPLRVGAGLILAYLHAWREVVACWRHLWYQVPWGFTAMLERAAMPMPHVLAYAATAIAAATAVAWMIGFLTRFFSILFLPLAMGGILAANSLNERAAAEACVLYMFVALTLIVTGSGWFSADALFEGRRR